MRTRPDVEHHFWCPRSGAVYEGLAGRLDRLFRRCWRRPHPVRGGHSLGWNRYSAVLSLESRSRGGRPKAPI